MTGAFIYWLCPECEYDLVSEPPTDFHQVHACPLCFDDSGTWVIMQGRPALDTDKPEGPDARL